MRPFLRSTSLAAVLILALPGCHGCDAVLPIFEQDAIVVQNAPDGDLIRVMIDCAALNISGVLAAVNDTSFSLSGGGGLAIFGLGDLREMSPRPFGETTLPGTNELVVFAPGRAPSLIEGIEWTPEIDVIEVRLRNPITIPTKVWIPSSFSRTPIEDARTTANQIWNDEGVGARFGTFEYAVPVLKPGESIPPPPTDTSDAVWRDEFIGSYELAHDKLNIFVFDQVSGLSTNGYYFTSTGPSGELIDIIVVGRNPGNTLLAHEAGHGFGLEHTDDPVFVRATSDFDNQNVMHSASNSRRYMTEGQIFRAHAKSESMLWRFADPVSRWTPRTIRSNDGYPPLEYLYDRPPICRRLRPDGSRGDCAR